METEKPKKAKCEHCGANLASYWHTMSTGIFSALVKAIRHVHKTGVNDFNMARDIPSLTKNEFSNFQKLRFHGLIAHSGGHKRWLITKRGGEFLRGDIKIPLRVQTYRNKVIGHSKEEIHVSDLRGKLPQFESEFAWEYAGMVPELTTGKLF